MSGPSDSDRVILRLEINLSRLALGWNFRLLRSNKRALLELEIALKRSDFPCAQIIQPIHALDTGLPAGLGPQGSFHDYWG
jgi:hypothetical protein